VLIIENTLLLVIDVQEKLLRVMFEKEVLVSNLQKLIKCCEALGIPVFITEQNPSGLGHTTAEILDLVPGSEKLTKYSFNCCAETGFCEQLRSSNRRQILMCGIESHICVYQTAIDLLAAGYEVQVVIDAVSSRTEQNKELAINRLASEGAKITGVEMALFELLKTSKTQGFKEISAIVKDQK
jgi:nicotinamidase-related amidase